MTLEEKKSFRFGSHDTNHPVPYLHEQHSACQEKPKIASGAYREDTNTLKLIEG